jgi:hypothetical protein
MERGEDLEKRAREFGCSLHHEDSSFGLIMDEQVEVLNKCIVSIGKKPLVPYEQNGHSYLGFSEKSSNCPNCFPFGKYYICQNPARIQQGLDEQKKKTSEIF